jgi:hypothetical protein
LYTGLSQHEEVSPGPYNPNAIGTAHIEIDSAAHRVCSTLTWDPSIGTPNAARIHRGTPWTEGPIVVVLSPTSGRNCTTADRAVLAAIAKTPTTTT